MCPHSPLKPINRSAPIPSTSHVACSSAMIPFTVFHPLVVKIAFLLWIDSLRATRYHTKCYCGWGFVACSSLSLFPSPSDRYLGCQDARAKTSERPPGQWPGCGSCKAGMDIASSTPRPVWGGGLSRRLDHLFSFPISPEILNSSSWSWESC